MPSPVIDTGKQRDDTPSSSERIQPDEDDHTPGANVNCSKTYHLPPDYQDFDKPLGRGLPSRPNWHFDRLMEARTKHATPPRLLVTVGHTHSRRNDEPNDRMATTTCIHSDDPPKPILTTISSNGNLRLSSFPRLPDLPEEEILSENFTTTTLEPTRKTKPRACYFIPGTIKAKNQPPTSFPTSSSSLTLTLTNDPLPAYLDRIKHIYSVRKSLHPDILEVCFNHLKKDQKSLRKFLRLCRKDERFLSREIEALNGELDCVVGEDDGEGRGRG
ncbi:hypothetical protein MMC30_004671 [Trapelia coarctata]|nr:hypothetical protein [Trapelia coarctata]